MVEARQHQNGSERGSRFMLGSQRSHYHFKKIRALLTAGERQAERTNVKYD